MEHEQRPPLEGGKPYTEKTPEDFRVDFRKDWEEYHRGQLSLPQEGQKEEDATATVQAYEVLFDPMNPQERGHYVTQFGLSALRAGYDIAGNVTIPASAFTKDGEALTSITYFLKEHAQQTEGKRQIEDEIT